MAPYSYNRGDRVISYGEATQEEESITGAETGDASIFNKFKKQYGEINRRPGFLSVIRMDNSQLNDDTRSNDVMTPQNNRDGLNLSKGDLNNSSHYYRFKRHSLGY